MLTVTLRRMKNSRLMLASKGNLSIVVHRLPEMHEMGFVPVLGTRGVWVRK